MRRAAAVRCPAPVSLWAQGWLVSVQSSAKPCVGHTCMWHLEFTLSEPSSGYPGCSGPGPPLPSRSVPDARAGQSGQALP